MSRTIELKEESPDDMEEFQSISDTVVEILEAIDSLITDKDFVSDSATDLEKIEMEALATGDGKQAAKAVEIEGEKFLKNYLNLKAKRGLNTQEDVSKLTGIDRRYISIIENGKHRPQLSRQPGSRNRPRCHD